VAYVAGLGPSRHRPAGYGGSAPSDSTARDRYGTAQSDAADVVDVAAGLAAAAQPIGVFVNLAGGFVVGEVEQFLTAELEEGKPRSVGLSGQAAAGWGWWRARCRFRW
jgi:hypothetical protein